MIAHGLTRFFSGGAETFSVIDAAEVGAMRPNVYQLSCFLTLLFRWLQPCRGQPFVHMTSSVRLPSFAHHIVALFAALR